MSNLLKDDIWSEERLISGLVQGQEAAFRALIRQYQGRLFGVAFGITQDREESLDIVQEVFIRVFQKIRYFKQEAKLSTWLHRITVNQCLNIKRGWKRRFKWFHQSMGNDTDEQTPELQSNAHFPETLYQEKEFKREFGKALKKLPAASKAVFVLKEMEGLSYEEIADVLKIKRGTVSSRLFHARRQLKKSLASYLDKEPDNG